MVSHHAYKHLLDEVDHVLSLERAAHTTLCLVQDLQSSTAQVSSSAPAPLKDSAALPSLRTPLDRDTERAQFLMKLAPRIRRLESDTITCLSSRLESVLKQLQQKRQENDDDDDDENENEGQAEVRIRIVMRTGVICLLALTSLPRLQELLMIGHCMRGLVLLGKGKEAENVFARVAIM